MKHFHQKCCIIYNTIFTGRCSLFLFSFVCSVAPTPKYNIEKWSIHTFTHYVWKNGSDEPTNAPVIIKAEFSKVKPIPAAAQPEYELSIEITTGISAPPIGIINKNPIKETPSKIKIN